MQRMAQKKPAAGKSIASLHKAADTLSTLLAQEVKELDLRQRAARKAGMHDGDMKGLKEATAVLKDLTGVADRLNAQSGDAEAQTSGVVVLPLEKGEADP